MASRFPRRTDMAPPLEPAEAPPVPSLQLVTDGGEATQKHRNFAPASLFITDGIGHPSVPSVNPISLTWPIPGALRSQFWSFAAVPSAAFPASLATRMHRFPRRDRPSATSTHHLVLVRQAIQNSIDSCSMFMSLLSPSSMASGSACPALRQHR